MGQSNARETFTKGFIEYNTTYHANRVYFTAKMLSILQKEFDNIEPLMMKCPSGLIMDLKAVESIRENSNDLLEKMIELAKKHMGIQ